MEYIKDFELYIDGVPFSKCVNNEARKWFNFFINRNLPLFHYTSQTALMNILSNNSLWFSEASHLNDASEGKYLYKVFGDFLSSCSMDADFEYFKTEVRKKIIDIDDKYFFDCCTIKELNTFPHYYICSFCMNGDALAMWNYYSKSAKKTGYNIEFSLKTLRKSIGESLYNTELPGEYRIYRVLYDPKKQKSLLKSATSYFYKKWKASCNKDYILYYFARYLYVIKFAFKHPAFAPEQEVRFLIKVLNLNDEDITVDSDRILVREAENGFIPYISLPFMKSDVKHIMASPLTENYESAKYILQKYGYENVKVDKSEIPLRY